MKFKKMHGLGNDFVVLDHRKEPKDLDTATILLLTDRRFGVGCDQVLIMENSQKADVFMRIYNVDASEASACGNGTRCIAHLYMSENNTDSCTIETIAGVLECKQLENNMVSVDMGKPSLTWQEIGLLEEIDTLHLAIKEGPVDDPVAVGMGNPHCVFFLDSIADVDIEAIGPVVENHPLYPNKTNVEFVQVRDDGRLRVRTWERGSGLTLACGSAACASAVAAIRRGLTTRKIEVVMDGGPLNIEWLEESEHVIMSGPVSYVFDAELINL